VEEGARGEKEFYPVKSARALPVETGVAVVLLCVLIYFSVRLPAFHSSENLVLLAKQSTQLMLIAVGMTLVIATGGIDISVGSVVALCAMTLGAISVRTHGNLALAAAGAILVGCLVGLLNGLFIARGKLPPILVTLATFAAARAGASLFNNGGSISDIPPALNDIVDRTRIVGLPLLFWISLAALAGGSLLLRRTTYGRELLALGGNRTAARLSGIPTERTELLVYTLSGTLAGLVGVINTAMKATATPDAGQYMELTAIAAVVLGGTAITGGQATLLGTGLGVATIGTLISGIRLQGEEDRLAWFLIGAALLLAVEVQRARSRLRRSQA
jgi:ribose/xylose/arabinose/galactoside ABC-type transport system permease subunit